MARVELSARVFDDFDRFVDHLEQFEVEDVPARIADIVRALGILSHSPLIGRKVRGGKRELVIGEAATGYVALYQFLPSIDTVFVVAVRSQREDGYKRTR